MIVLLIYIYIWIHELSSPQHVLRIPFTEIQDLEGIKRRSESKDISIFENVAKCEHPCHSYTNEYGIAGWTKYYAIWLRKRGGWGMGEWGWGGGWVEVVGGWVGSMAVGKFNALFLKNLFWWRVIPLGSLIYFRYNISGNCFIYQIHFSCCFITVT